PATPEPPHPPPRCSEKAPVPPPPPPPGGGPRGPQGRLPRPEAEVPPMPRAPRQRRAAVAVELAIVMPFLAFMFIVAVDFCRVFYYSQVVDTAARNGALYLADPNGPNQSHYATLQDAVQGDASPDFASQ